MSMFGPGPQPAAERCHKAGCNDWATHLVRLTDPDGIFECWTCREHALQFASWVAGQVDYANDEFLIAELQEG